MCKSFYESIIKHKVVDGKHTGNTSLEVYVFNPQILYIWLCSFNVVFLLN